MIGTHNLPYASSAVFSEDLGQGLCKCVAHCRFAYARDGDTNRRVGRALCRWHEAALRPSSPIPVTIACPDPRRPPSSAPRDLTVSCVAVERAFALPLSRGISQALPRVARIDLGVARFEGAPAPLPCPGSRAKGSHSHRGVHSAVLFDCFPAAVPSDGAPAAEASPKGERSQAEETRAPALRCRVFRSLVENGRFWRLGFFLFLPHANGAQRAAAVDPASPSGHYVEAPAAAFSRSLRFENSRYPAWERRYADFSDTLHFSLIVPWSLALAPARTPWQGPPPCPPHGIAAGTG